MTGRNHQSQRPVGSLVLIDLQKTLAKRMDGHSDDCVRLRIEVGPAAERLGRDRVLLDAIRPSLKMLLADVRQDPCQVTGPAQHARRQQPIKFFPLRVSSGICVYSVIGCPNSSHDPQFYTLPPPLRPRPKNTGQYRANFACLTGPVCQIAPVLSTSRPWISPITKAKPSHSFTAR